jgi:DNA-binding MarR family transcriptional regulator
MTPVAALERSDRRGTLRAAEPVDVRNSLDHRSASDGGPAEQPGQGDADLMERVLVLQDRLLGALQARHPGPWLSLELTMSELKALLVLGASGSASGGQLARAVGVGLSTMTGVVDRMRDQGLVTRAEDTADRRVTRVALTEHGQALVAELHQLNRERFGRLLARLDADALRTVERAFDHLLRAALDEPSGGPAAGDPGRAGPV